ncbi:hypothetical protein J6590_044173 [Homalodisca vitripennis]|nr:hypothetical protein J6590_044173 [Homalodisca vitripennis]
MKLICSSSGCGGEGCRGRYRRDDMHCPTVTGSRRQVRSHPELVSLPRAMSDMVYYNPVMYGQHPGWYQSPQQQYLSCMMEAAEHQWPQHHPWPIKHEMSSGGSDFSSPSPAFSPVLPNIPEYSQPASFLLSTSPTDAEPVQLAEGAKLQNSAK